MTTKLYDVVALGELPLLKVMPAKEDVDNFLANV